MQASSLSWIAALVLSTALGCAPHAAHHTGHGAGDPGSGERTRDGQLSPRLQNLGTHSRRVSTRDPQAQRYFDQGLILAYAFNHAEAVRSFREAQRIDPDAAMAYWGEAYALGPNINAPMDASAVSPAWSAVQKARALGARASPVERDLIAAQAQRYAEHGGDRAALDRAYAEAMQSLARKYPGDADVQAIAAESIMDTDPWNYWTNDGHPRPYTADVLALIERTLAIDPDHPMGLHLHIHAVEASQNPERAVSSGERLGQVVPGAGHLVHMPSHIFFRVGRYADAAAANLQAIRVDEDYITQCRAQGIYPAAYYPHNVHFLWIARSYQGQGAAALDAARKTATAAHHPMPLSLDQFHAAPLHTLVRFARWDEILREPQPPAEQLYLGVIWHYARGMAFAARGDPRAAGRELTALRALLARPDFPAQMLMANSPPLRLAQIAERVLSGEVAQAGGNPDAALAAFASAVLLEDSLTYNEPPDWPYPARHWLGAALLAAGRPIEAESVYLEDLRRHPDNGWALFGLVQALRAQGEGRGRDLAQAGERFEKAWGTADVALKDSREMSPLRRDRNLRVSERLPLRQNSRCTMRRIGSSARLAALVLVFLVPAARSFAWDHWGHGHGHGHWHGRHYWGGPRLVVGIGPALGWGYYPGWYWPRPYYPPPYGYWPPPAVREEPQVYVERPSPAPAEYWYYCESARDYYPRVPSCPEPWMKVLPEPRS